MLAGQHLFGIKALDQAASDEGAQVSGAGSGVGGAGEQLLQADVLGPDAVERLAGKGAPTATGEAERSSGPSSSYAGRIQAKVRPNIVFTDDVAGNPKAEVEVRMAPDGTIISKKVVKGSGVRSWDDAVLRALDKTEVLPRDIDGRVHSPLIIEFKLRG